MRRTAGTVGQVVTVVDPAPDTATGAPSVEEQERSSASRFARWVVEWVVILVISLGAALLVRTFLLQPFLIPSASMEPALRIGDRVLVNKISYRLHEIHRGDVVVFERPACDRVEGGLKDLIKRVVAVGGETVEARDGSVFVEGERVREPYLSDGVVTADFGPVEVPAGHLWVMGDNRGNSKDSRFLCGPRGVAIDESTVVGRGFLRVWPISSIGRL